MRFGGHSYVQRLKPSLRTAGAVSAGKRPKTAPVSVSERWNTKEKVITLSNCLHQFVWIMFDSFSVLKHV